MDDQKQNNNAPSLEFLSQELRSILLNSCPQTQIDLLNSNEHKTNAESPSDALLIEHQRDLLEDSISSGDEDFRCVATTPPKSEKTNAGSPSDALLFEHQRDLLEDSISSGDEDFRCVATTPPKSEELRSILLNSCPQTQIDLLNSNEHKTNAGSPSDALLIEHQRDLLEDSISSGDEDFRCVATTPPKSETHSQAVGFLASNEHQMITYDREKLLLIKKSKTDGEWLSFLYALHWSIEEMPFQLDPDLRCCFGKQQRVLREREENVKKNIARTERRQRQRKLIDNKTYNNNDTRNDLNINAEKDKAIENESLALFSENQTKIWIKYLAYINLEIKAVAEDV